MFFVSRIFSVHQSSQKEARQSDNVLVKPFKILHFTSIPIRTMKTDSISINKNNINSIGHKYFLYFSFANNVVVDRLFVVNNKKYISQHLIFPLTRLISCRPDIRDHSFIPHNFIELGDYLCWFWFSMTLKVWIAYIVCSLIIKTFGPGFFMI